jgi:hypothetical protein
VAEFEDTVEALRVRRVVRRHHDGEVSVGREEEALDDVTAGLVEGGVGYGELQ